MGVANGKTSLVRERKKAAQQGVMPVTAALIGLFFWELGGKMRLLVVKLVVQNYFEGAEVQYSPSINCL